MAVKVNLSKRKKVVLDAIEAMGEPFTALQLWRYISKSDAGVSRATVYRILQGLREDGTIKDIVLSHGLHISIRTEEEAYCIMECVDCGRFQMCPDLAATMTASSQNLSMIPGQIAIHIRARCRDRQQGVCQRAIL
jgi:Fe2+ or Zn2+ uptake regulation protein